MTTLASGSESAWSRSPERVAAPDHHVAVVEPDEAAIHGAARQDDAALAFAAVAVPAEDVRGHLSGRTAPTNTTLNLARFQQRPYRDPDNARRRPSSAGFFRAGAF